MLVNDKYVMEEHESLNKSVIISTNRNLESQNNFFYYDDDDKYERLSQFRLKIYNNQDKYKKIIIRIEFVLP